MTRRGPNWPTHRWRRCNPRQPWETGKQFDLRPWWERDDHADRPPPGDPAADRWRRHAK